MFKRFLGILLLSVFCVNSAVPVGAENVNYSKPVPNYEIFDSETDKLFENSLFIGDSVMLGFKNYLANKPEGFLSDPVVAAAGSFSLYHALSPVSSANIHPIYNGREMLVEDIAAVCGAKNIYICLGLNDLGWTEKEKAVEEYNDLIFRIHTKAPNAKIYVISTTYIAASGQKVNYTNEKVRAFNDAMYEYCGKYDYIEFINIGDRLIGADGGLKPEYASDGYVHLTNAAYDVWVKVLRANADYFARVEAAKTE